MEEGIPGGSAAAVPIAQHVHHAGADAGLALAIVCIRGCVRVCVRKCVRECMRTCVRVYMRKCARGCMAKRVEAA